MLDDAYESGDIKEFKRLSRIILKINKASKLRYLREDDIKFREKYNKKNLKRFNEKSAKRGGNIEKDM